MNGRTDAGTSVLETTIALRKKHFHYLRERIQNFCKCSPLSTFLSTSSYATTTTAVPKMYAAVFARSIFRIQRQQILVARHARLLTTPPSKPPNDPGSSTSPHRPPSSSTNARPPSDSQKEPSSPQPETPPSPTSISLDFMPEQNEPQRTGAKSSKDSLSSIERKRRNASRFSLAMLGLGAVAAVVYMGRDWEGGELKHLKIVCHTYSSTMKSCTQ